MIRNPLFLTDQYKNAHYRMYPEGTVRIYSNFTPRKSRIKGIDYVVVYGLQYFLIEYLIDAWNQHFFFNYSEYIGVTANSEYLKKKRKGVIAEYKRMMDYTLGKDSVSMEHIQKLQDLGYLPLEIKALPEGTLCPIGVPAFTITNTVDHAYWLVNYLETIISCIVWQPITSATLAHKFRGLLDSWAIKTTGSTNGVEFQGHDFSMRGMSSLESACTSGAGHLLSFSGSDSVPAVAFLEEYYGANITTEMVGVSVPATEHSVMCMGTKDDEIGTFARLLDLYPSGILSVVSDTWDLWKVCTEYLPQLKEKILARDGKLVIRPDSGDPVDIICGVRHIEEEGKYYRSVVRIAGDGDMRDTVYTKGEEIPRSVAKGVIELLWDVFGGTINEQGYKVLDPHIGAIYGDSINLERAQQICERLAAKGFASTNIVLGVGSFTYQYNTRDTFGFAMKATYGEVEEELPEEQHFKGMHKVAVGREIFKDPITDDGTKRSLKGLIRVDYDENGKIKAYDQQTEEQEKQGLLQTVFLDGKLVKRYTLAEIRSTLNKQ